MKTVWCALIFTFFIYTVNAQDCPKYAKLIAEANNLSAKGNFIDALNKYQTAQTYCKSKLEEVQNKIKEMFLEIEKLKTKEQEAKKKSVEAQKIVEKKNVQLSANEKKLDTLTYRISASLETLQQLKNRLNYVQDSLQKQRLNELQVYQKFADSIIQQKTNLQLITTYIDRLINSENTKANVQQQIQKEQQNKDFNIVLKNEYKVLYSTCEPNKEKIVELEIIINKINASRSSYDKVSQATGIPWYFIGILHAMEGSLSFKKHLHNGDPLTARTVTIPKGRPPTGSPPFTWEESAIDALKLEGFTINSDWSIPGILYSLEKYNGMGYRKRGINTPYLWGYSNHYYSGKFSADGVFDPDKVSKIIGAAVLLKVMDEKRIIYN